MKTKEVEIEGQKFILKRMTGKDGREVKEKAGLLAEMGKDQKAKINLALYQHLSVAKSIVEPAELRDINKLEEELDEVVIARLYDYVDDLNKLSEEAKKD